MGALDRLGPEGKHLGGDRVIVVTDKGLVRAGVGDSVLARLKEVVGQEAYPQGSSDFTPLANKVKAADQDVILLTS